MKIKGFVTIRVTDANTQEVKHEHSQENTITAQFIDALVRGQHNYGELMRSFRITASTSLEEPDYNLELVSNCLATGYIPAGITSPAYTPNGANPYVEIRNRISYVGFPRTFHTIALTQAASSNDHTANGTTAPITVSAFAYLKLTEPCEQAGNDIVDIYYRVQFPIEEGSGMLPRTGPAIAKLFGGIAVPGYYEGPGYFDYFHARKAIQKKPTQPYFSPSIEHLNSKQYFASVPGNGPDWSSRTSNYGLLKRVFSRTSVPTDNDTLGRIFNLILIGSSDATTEGADAKSCYALDTYLPSDASPFQGLFSHSADAPKPFHDPDYLAVGSGKPTLSGTWTGLWPELYRIGIQQGGTISSATYKWSVRPTLGFEGNSYTESSAANIFRNDRVPAFPGCHGYRSSNIIRPYLNRKILMLDSTGLTVLDMMSGEYRNFDSTTTPALPVTNLGQVEINKATGEIYVSCRNTGLYRINADLSSVNHLSVDPCYGVDVGRNGRVFAIFGNRLASSDDWAVALPFSYTGITDNKWDTVIGLKVDPENPNDQMLILAGSGYQTVWWSVAAPTAIAGIAGNSGPINWTTYDVSDTGSFWAILMDGYWGDPCYRGVYGSASTSTNTADKLYVNNVSGQPWGQVYFTEDGLLITQNWLVDKNLNKVITLNLNSQQDTHFCYLGNGLMTSGQRIFQLLPNRTWENGISGGGLILTPGLWNTYGWNPVAGAWAQEKRVWNGSAWTVVEMAGRTAHPTNEALQNGITVRFEETNLQNPSGFTAGNYYTQVVCQGRMIDSSIAQSTYKFQWHFGRIEKSAPLSTTLPSAAPYLAYVNHSPFGGSTPDAHFLAIDHEEASFHKIQIAGYPNPVANIYFDNTATMTPGPNEVVINPRTGSILCNAADAGKAITGTYFYAKTPAEVVVADAANRTLLLGGRRLGFRSDVSYVDGAWQDLSGLANHSSQPIASARPTLSSDAADLIAGKPVVKFNGTQFIKVPAASINDPQHGIAFFMVCRVDAGFSSNTLFSMGSDQLNSANGRYNFRLYRTSGNELAIAINSDQHFPYNTYTFAQSFANSLTAGQYQLLSVILQPTGFQDESTRLTRRLSKLIVRANGTTIATRDFYLPAKVKRSWASIGVYGGDAVLTDYFRGSFASFDVFNAAVSVREAMAIESQIHSLYSAALPALPF